MAANPLDRHAASMPGTDSIWNEMMDSFTNPEIQKCPFPFIARLHESAPVYQDPISHFFIVSRFDDIAYVSAHPEIFSNKTEVILGGKNVPGADRIQALYEAEGFPRFHTLVTNDPPSHTQFRMIVDKVFAPSFVKSLEPYITQLANDLIDDFIDQKNVDIQQQYCIRLPMYVISDQVGVPRQDWHRIKKWSDASVGLINPALDIEERLKLCRIHIDLQQYLAETRKRYLAEPADSYFSRLATAEVDGVRLTEEQFVNVAEQLLVAGNETTTGAIGHAIAHLIRNPDMADTLRQNPELVINFTEEVLRVHAPSPHLYREALEDVELSGVAIPKGSTIMLSYLAGNHDPSRYEDPDMIKLDRPGIRNHLAFGRGIHFCIGNQLARAELRIAVATLLKRVKDMRFDPDYPEPGFAPIYHVHSIDGLHVTLTPAGEAVGA